MPLRCFSIMPFANAQTEGGTTARATLFQNIHLEWLHTERRKAPRSMHPTTNGAYLWGTFGDCPSPPPPPPCKARRGSSHAGPRAALLCPGGARVGGSAVRARDTHRLLGVQPGPFRGGGWLSCRPQSQGSRTCAPAHKRRKFCPPNTTIFVPQCPSQSAPHDVAIAFGGVEVKWRRSKMFSAEPVHQRGTFIVTGLREHRGLMRRCLDGAFVLCPRATPRARGGAGGGGRTLYEAPTTTTTTTTTCPDPASSPPPSLPRAADVSGPQPNGTARDAPNGVHAAVPGAPPKHVDAAAKLVWAVPCNVF